MKKRILHFSWALLCAGLFACSKNAGKDDQQPDPAPRPGTVTQAGVPDGTPAAQKVIGAAGGSLASHDGGLTLNIPAGALTADQTVKITRISSTNPLGAGQGYRLEPHGLTFSKPVTLTINAGDSLLDGTIKGAVGIAYRNDKGIWMAMPKAVVNETAKTVSVQTTHFSDWEFFKGVWLRSTTTYLDMGEATALWVVGDIKIFNDPLESETPLSESKIDAKLIKEWKLAQDYGTLIPRGAEAVYDAPDYLAGKPWNPAVVTVELNGPDNGKYVLMRSIVVTAGIFVFKIGNGAEQYFEASPLIRVGDRWSAFDAEEDNEGGADISLGWKGDLTPGNYPWSYPRDLTGTYGYITIGNQTWNAIYDDPATKEEITFPSPGQIRIVSVNETTGYVTGTFSATKAGTASSKFKETVTMTGRFRIMKPIQ